MNWLAPSDCQLSFACRLLSSTPYSLLLRVRHADAQNCMWWALYRCFCDTHAHRPTRLWDPLLAHLSTTVCPTVCLNSLDNKTSDMYFVFGLQLIASTFMHRSIDHCYSPCAYALACHSLRVCLSELLNIRLIRILFAKNSLEICTHVAYTTIHWTNCSTVSLSSRLNEWRRSYRFPAALLVFSTAVQGGPKNCTFSFAWC